MSYSYILEINLLSVASFANIFSHLRVIFVLFMVSFAFNSVLFSFVFIYFFTLGGESKRSCCYLCHRVFYLCFPLRIL